MGHFDKLHTTASGANKKKVLVAVTLAVALAVVLGIQFSRSSPRSAAASSGNASSDSAISTAPISQRTVSEELAALQNDPTSSLLHGSNHQDASLLIPPRDPFRLSQTLRDSLTKAVAATPVVADRSVPRAVSVQPQAPNLDGLKLQGIFLDHEKPAAIVNGSIVYAGMTVGNVRVCDILQDRIIVQNPSFPTGPKTEVTLKSSLNR